MSYFLMANYAACAKILWLAREVYHSQLFLHSRFSQVILTQILIETLLFRTRLPTRQDSSQNRDNA